MKISSIISSDRFDRIWKNRVFNRIRFDCVRINQRPCSIFLNLAFSAVKNFYFEGYGFGLSRRNINGPCDCTRSCIIGAAVTCTVFHIRCFWRNYVSDDGSLCCRECVFNSDFISQNASSYDHLVIDILSRLILYFFCDKWAWISCVFYLNLMIRLDVGKRIGIFEISNRYIFIVNFDIFKNISRSWFVCYRSVFTIVNIAVSNSHGALVRTIIWSKITIIVNGNTSIDYSSFDLMF